MWTLDSIELNGGFLPGLKLTLPHGLICIIGPRGSGKSTLAEALRFSQSKGPSVHPSPDSICFRQTSALVAW